MGEYIATARRSGDDWFLGSLTNSKSREITVPLDFRGKGRWKARLWKDADDSRTNAEHLNVEDRYVTSTDTLKINMAPSGGCAIQFQLEKTVVLIGCE